MLRLHNYPTPDTMLMEIADFLDQEAATFANDSTNGNTIVKRERANAALTALQSAATQVRQAQIVKN